MRVKNQSQKFNRLPSEIARINDEYTAFCFDEACMYIISQLESEKKPIWPEDTMKEDGTRKTFLDVHLEKQRGGEKN